MRNLNILKRFNEFGLCYATVKLKPQLYIPDINNIFM